MKAENEKKLRNIQKVSKFLRAMCKVLLGLVAFGALVTVGLTLAGRGSISLFDNTVHLQLSPLTFPVRLAVAVLAAVMMSVFLKGIYHLHRLFGNYGRGEIFTTDSAAQIRQLGITNLLWFGVQLLWGFAIVAISGAYPTRSPSFVLSDGLGVVSISQGSSATSFQFHSDALVVGAIIIVISWFMEMAAEMREENELTV
jgi:hypothetical protein